MPHHKQIKQAHVVDVDMGYGHARAAFALKDLAGGEIISANNYKGIPAKDKHLWQQSRQVYETISRLKPIPLIGEMAFDLMDRFQEIPSFYPRRDLSRPSLQLRGIYRLIAKGQGKDLIERLRAEPLPLVTTFFTVAFMADYHGYPENIYLVTTDADIARHWAPMDPKKSRIIYVAANGRCQERLKLYGVPESNIVLTGFPLPKDLIGGYPEKRLQNDLMSRLCNLDPHGIFLSRYRNELEARLGKAMTKCAERSDHPLTVVFSVGGAGAQKKLGVDIMRSLKKRLSQGQLRLVLFGGLHGSVISYYSRAAREMGLGRELERNLLLPTFDSRSAYFQGFNDFLHQTDVLITKPSELSFYTALGLPIVTAPPIGSQENFNKVWLQYVGGGVPMMDPRYIDEWLFDWIDSGGLARMAWNGYVEAPTHGTYRIEDIVLGRKSEIHALPLIV